MSCHFSVPSPMHPRCRPADPCISTLQPRGFLVPTRQSRSSAELSIAPHPQSQLSEMGEFAMTVPLLRGRQPRATSGSVSLGEQQARAPSINPRRDSPPALVASARPRERVRNAISTVRGGGVKVFWAQRSPVVSPPPPLLRFVCLRHCEVVSRRVIVWVRFLRFVFSRDSPRGWLVWVAQAVD